MIHALKYEENKEVGIYLGEQIAYEIESSQFFNSIDYIIPVPLHPKKEKIRGYNQSLCIAKGIKEILKIKRFLKMIFQIYLYIVLVKILEWVVETILASILLRPVMLLFLIQIRLVTRIFLLKLMIILVKK